MDNPQLVKPLNKDRAIAPSEILLSLATPPVLFGMVAVQSLAQGLQNIGQVSEEVFRGHRLPILNLPVTEKEEESESH
ncbi:hypothetical protein IQ249_05660 [Lusitaniella coriacea LEGE 07157]|uniref:Uncharacterized protein n=1 Tax=Lusitaniella coriacea LEGE 07157 TaxID=945747 RepID=A0A8J7B3V8_9CYAN|nr:hypothetical protein [Lusitaniella coriacea]MBE9115382.1 hypothetical protein [Lusitaniella coriacea LEGE 07157]